MPRAFHVIPSFSRTFHGEGNQCLHKTRSSCPDSSYSIWQTYAYFCSLCFAFLTNVLQVNALKDSGNKAFQAKQYDQAIDIFTQAIALDPKNHVLYSNRSAAKAGKRMWAEALEDAEEVRHT